MKCCIITNNVINYGGNKMNFGEVLKKLRNDRNISQKTLANDLGIAQQSISAYEKGTSDPSIENLINFAKFFNVTIDYLVGHSLIPDKTSLTEDQEELFVYYDSLPYDKKNIVKEIVDSLYIKANKELKNEK